MKDTESFATSGKTYDGFEDEERAPMKQWSLAGGRGVAVAAS